MFYLFIFLNNITQFPLFKYNNIINITVFKYYKDLFNW